jgi:hypothetical protein
VQVGTHDELLAEGGLYREIHDLQLVHNADDEEEESLALEKPIYHSKDLG